MSNRKIAECISVRINVAQYEHIEFTKYGEEEIEFSSDEERVKKEDALREDLVASLMRDFREVPKQLGKGLAQALKVEEAIKKALPKWLSENPIPNIANTANKVDIKNTAKQFVEKAGAEPLKDIQVFDEPSVENKTVPVNASVVISGGGSSVEEKELFDDASVSSSPIVVTAPKVEVKETKVEVKVEETSSDGFSDVFATEDLFGDEK